uniref:TIR domain-containing protein n=1 Tax=Brassica campestris TaxID=3711 RepID=M4DZL0_BRACM
MNNNDEIKQTVYISFNINDSDVSSFIRYLVAALHREGIDVASEKSGHDLNKGWFSRIKLFVVVFSKPCTYSVACLEKLVKLLEFLREEDNVVVPVFNDAMAKQIENFSGAFEALGKSHSADQVTTWQRVLKEITGLRGHEYTNKLSLHLKLLQAYPNILLVLDGLQNAQDAESFLSGFNRFGPGSLLIITSSEREVLEKCHLNEIYELKGLNDEDALKLFTRCAFGKDVIDEELRKLSVSEIERCDGNPSTIRSHAAKMSRMETIDMESALGRFWHISSLCFQETMNTFSITPKQSFFITDAYNYQWDLENFSGFDLASSLEIRLSDLRGQCLTYDSRQKFFFSTISSTYLSDFTDLSLPNFTSPAIESMPIDLKILQLGQETLLVCQVNKPWEGYKVRKL